VELVVVGVELVVVGVELVVVGVEQLTKSKSKEDPLKDQITSSGQ
jgi:hypothetical protein